MHRESSRIGHAQIDPADQAKELKRKRAEHKESQASLDALSDLEYWDLELETRKCDGEPSREKEAMAKRLSHGDLLESARGLVKKEAQLKVQIDQTRDNAVHDRFQPVPRDSGIQSTFRKVLIHEHRSTNPEAEDELWCPVLGEYVDRSVMKAAHIFPYRLGEDVMKAVFGETSANEIFSPRNGLMLYCDVEEKFDKFLIVIVPAGPIESGRWKIRVLDSSILKEEVVGQWTYGSLDDREPVFKGNARPAARYLYWHYATAVMTMAERKSTRGWLQEMSKNCWATPGKYIRQNMLIALAERIGHSVPEDELQEHAISEPLIPHLDDKMAAKVVMNTVEEDNSDEARYDPEFS